MDQAMVIVEAMEEGMISCLRVVSVILKVRARRHSDVF